MLLPLRLWQTLQINHCTSSRHLQSILKWEVQPICHPDNRGKASVPVPGTVLSTFLTPQVNPQRQLWANLCPILFHLIFKTTLQVSQTQSFHKQVFKAAWLLTPVHPVCNQWCFYLDLGLRGPLLPMCHATSPKQASRRKSEAQRLHWGHPEGSGRSKTQPPPFRWRVLIPAGNRRPARTRVHLPGEAAHIILILNMCPWAQWWTNLLHISEIRLTESFPSWHKLWAQPQKALALLILSSA